MRELGVALGQMHSQADLGRRDTATYKLTRHMHHAEYEDTQRGAGESSE